LAELLVELSNVDKNYHIGSRRIAVLKGIDLTVRKGDFLSIMGPSGSGKSTLLNIIGTLDRPDRGEYRFRGRPMQCLSDTELSAFRSRSVGFVFQTFNLVSVLDVYENVKLPFLYSKVGRDEARARVIRAIEQVGLADRVGHRPAELSGGEMQRVAIARAIAARPEMILADEPTGNLDSKTGMEILSLLTELNKGGVTIIVITHDGKVRDLAARRIHIKDGELVEHAV
jgi:putative ABC transport system ATP-binding protein